ncbi:hypothetical protein ABRA89_00110 [Fulvimarina sp. MAC8]
MKPTHGRGFVAEADDHVLQVGLGDGVEIERSRQPSSQSAVVVLDTAPQPAGDPFSFERGQMDVG